MGWRETLEALYKSRDWKQATAAEREQAVKDVVTMSSLGAAAVGVTPVPLADIVVALPLQAAMVVAIGHIKGRDITREQSLTIARELTAVVGTHVVARRAFIALSRLLFPGGAGFLMAPWMFSTTYAMGKVAELYFDRPDAPGEAFKTRFKEALEEARKSFSKDAFLEFLRRRGQEAKDFAAAEPPAASTPPPPPEPKVVEAEWDESDPGARR